MKNLYFSIEEIKKYLNKQKNITESIENLSEENIIKSLDIEDIEDTCFNNEDSDQFCVKYEMRIGMTRRKEEQIKLHRNSNGKEGRYWMACSPKRISKNEQIQCNTEYKIRYWVNYGDNSTYGWFTVEQIIKWFDNPEIKLYEIAGTNERATR